MESSFIYYGTRMCFYFTPSICCCGCENRDINGSVLTELGEDIKNYNPRGMQLSKLDAVPCGH